MKSVITVPKKPTIAILRHVRSGVEIGHGLAARGVDLSGYDQNEASFLDGYTKTRCDPIERILAGVLNLASFNLATRSRWVSPESRTA